MSTIRDVRDFLILHDHFWIISHQHPDGDTLGSAYALCHALRAHGKHADVHCSDPIPPQYRFLTEGCEPMGSRPDTIVTVDVADVQLLGEALGHLSERIDLCIDHHPSNKMEAGLSLVDPSAAAAAELVYHIIQALEAPFTRQMAICIYTGLSTDTGCFRYSNTTAESHLIAAEMIGFGFDHAGIDRALLETKSKSRIMIERMVLDTLEYHFDNTCALAVITTAMIEASGAELSELDGVSSIPRQIEGIEVGITIRQRAESEFRVSMRTNLVVDASAICLALGGGGHARAAGCTLFGTLDEVKTRLLQTVGEVLRAHEIRNTAD